MRHWSDFTWVDWPGSPHQIVTSNALQGLNEPLKRESVSRDTVQMTDVSDHLREPVSLVADNNQALRPGSDAMPLPLPAP